MYILLSALLTPPNGIGFIAGVFIAVDAAGFFAWCFVAKAADVDRLSIARLTMSLLILELLWTGNKFPLNCFERVGSPSAQKAGVSDFTMRKGRQLTVSNLAVETRTGRDGKVRSCPAPKMGADFGRTKGPNLCDDIAMLLHRIFMLVAGAMVALSMVFVFRLHHPSSGIQPPHRLAATACEHPPETALVPREYSCE